MDVDSYIFRRAGVLPESSCSESLSRGVWTDRCASSSAFSLVEVSLALLVVAIGMLAILGLFPAGLDQVARSEDDTHAAQFADEVFNGMRAWAQEDFGGLATYQVSCVADFPGYWGGVMQPIFVTGTNVEARVYEHVSAKSVNHAFRYRLGVDYLSPDRASATLEIRSGQFGSFKNPSVFYTEFYRP